MQIKQVLPVIETEYIPIWDEKGTKIAEVHLPEKIIPTFGRRGGYGKAGVYYKGAGIIYRGHLSNAPKEYERILKPEELLYQKYTVINPLLVKKFGIFTFPHQPIFSDMEGACGKKEQRLLVNQQKFQRSAIEEIIEVIDTPIPEHKIYAYRTKRLCTESSEVLHLFEYLLQSDFNSAWDKNLWEDVEGYGYVRDLADWFESGHFNHKLGTIYAMLHSIFAVDKYLFAMISKEIAGYNYLDAPYIPYLSALIVKKYNPDALDEFEGDISKFDISLNEKLWACIYSGKACCHLEKEEEWAWVRDAYMEKLPKQSAMLQQEMTLDEMRYEEIIG